MFEKFSKELPEFLWDLRFNNNKQWFDELRDLYKKCLQIPFKELANEVYNYMNDTYTSHVFDLHVSRINRDLRRPSPFGPYKDHMWFSIYNAYADEYDRPSFYFSISTDGWSVGCGIFKAPQTVMLRYRDIILNEPEKITPLAEKISESKIFVLGGDDYKRSKGDAGELLTPWINKKELYVTAGREYNELFYSHDLKDFIIQSFDFLMTYYEFIEHICDEVRENG